MKEMFVSAKDFQEVETPAQINALRDDFAKIALPALITGRSWNHTTDSNEIIMAWADGAYAVADAMILARSRK